MTRQASLLLALVLASAGSILASAQTYRLLINGGITSTFSRSVKLSLAADDKTGVVGYLVSESAASPSADSAGWVPVDFTASFQGELPFTLGPGDGKKTVYAWFRDSTGAISNPASAAILLASHVIDNVHEIAVTPDGKELWAWSIDSHNILVADLRSPDYPVIADIQLPGSRSVPASRIVFSPDGRYAYCSDALQLVYEEQPLPANQVLVIDATTKAVVGSIDLPANLSPTGSLAVGPDGRYLYAVLADWSSNQTGIGKLDIQARRLLGFTPLDGAGFVSSSPDGRFIYVTQGWGFFAPAPNSVSAVNADTLQLASTVAVGKAPGYLAIGPDRRTAYVANEGSNDVSVIDLTTMKLLATIAVGSAPKAIAIAPDGRKAYVANSGFDIISQSGSTVSVIDTAKSAVVTTISVSAEPDAVAMDPDGSRVYVPSGGANGRQPAQFQIIDVQSDVRLPSGILRGAAYFTPTGIDTTPDGRRLFVVSESADSLLIVDTLLRSTVASLHIYPRGVKVSADGRRVYVFSPQYPRGGEGRLFVLDANSFDILQSIELGMISTSPGGEQTACRIILNAKEDTAYLTNLDSDEVIVVDLNARKVKAIIPFAGSSRQGVLGPRGLALTPDEHKLFVSSPASPVVGVLDTARNAVIDSISLPNPASALRVSSDGRRVYASSSQTTRMMAIIDADTHQVQRIVDFPSSVAAVTDFLLSADGRYAYVACFDPNWIMVYDLLATDPGRALVKVIKTGVDPFNLAIRADRKVIYGTDFTSDDVFLVNTETNSLLERIPLQVVSPQPLAEVLSVVSAASLKTGAVAPGEIVGVFGSALGPPRPGAAEFDAAGLLPTSFSDTRVLFDGLPAPIMYTSAGQWIAIVPYGLSGRRSAKLQVEYLGDRSAGVDLVVAQSAPGIFTMSSTGRGPGAIANQDGTLNSAENPAPRGSVISLFATGEGQTNPAGVDGQRAAAPLPGPVLPVVVGIANLGAELHYAGAVGGFSAGLLQVDVRVPSDAPTGASVPLVINVGGVFSQPGVTIAIK